MIRKLEVKGLNNRVDGAWDFNEDLNIITGRNGSGKTTLLKLIWYLISGNVTQVLSEIVFQSVSIETDLFSISLVKDEPNAGKFKCTFIDQEPMDINFNMPLKGTDLLQLSRANPLFSHARNRSLFFPSFRRIEGGFSYLSKNATRNLSAWLNDTAWIRSGNLGWRSAEEGMEMLEKAIAQLSEDLSVYGEHEFVAAISTYDIDELLTQRYADVSKKMDQLHLELSEELTQLSKEITQTIPETKVLDDTPILEDIQKQVLKVNRELEQNAKEREALLKPFSMLGEQIRDMFQYEGIHFPKGVTLGKEGGAIESDKLSAGEKQMLSFWFYNTFSKNAAIFIDEPELSLHVDWQRLLLPTLLEQETGNQFFVATHSPFIYGKYPEREILLGEDRGGD